MDPIGRKLIVPEFEDFRIDCHPESARFLCSWIISEPPLCRLRLDASRDSLTLNKFR